MTFDVSHYFEKEVTWLLGNYYEYINKDRVVKAFELQAVLRGRKEKGTSPRPVQNVFLCQRSFPLIEGYHNLFQTTLILYSRETGNIFSENKFSRVTLFQNLALWTRMSVLYRDISRMQYIASFGNIAI